MSKPPVVPLEITLRPGARYRLERLIASSSFGHVWAATWLDTGLAVAVKMVRTDRMAAAPAHARHVWVEAMEREIAFLTGIRSPHIVRGLDSGTHDGLPVLVLEALDCSLHALIAPSGAPRRPLAPEQARQWLDELSEGVRHIHRCGFRHLDLKPQNLLLTADSALGRRIKIADFGACLPLSQTRHPFHGTAGWLAPSQTIPVATDATGAPLFETDATADHYALGLLLYFMVTGAQPAFCQEARRQLRHLASRVNAKGANPVDWRPSTEELACFADALGERQRVEAEVATWTPGMAMPDWRLPGNRQLFDRLNQLLAP